MKKVLYLTNIEVPYRVRFFNELARFCDLTVLYERKKSENRNDQWAKSEERNYRVRYLRGIKVTNESAFSFRILKEIFSDYDRIIIGCYKSPVQMLAILVMRLFRIPYIVNLDGEPFLEGNGLKEKFKRFFLSGADKYLTAGEKAAQSLRSFAGDKEVIPYYFSSLSEGEIAAHQLAAKQHKRNDTILVVGQYYDYKGMDVALETARLDSDRNYQFVGMGTRTERFQKDFEGKIPANVKIVPFLQKQELERVYQCCAMLVLPSRRECWGLVIHEAASFGMPIVSTWGSGAAVEFLADAYPQYLAEPADAVSLYRCIRAFLASEKKEEYCRYLIKKSESYTIEASVQAHLRACGIGSEEY